MNRGDQLELDDLLEEWKHLTPDSEQALGDLQPVQLALRDMDHCGHGRPADELIRESHQKHRLPE